MQNVCKCESHYLKVTVATSHFATRVLSAPDSSIELSGSSFAESGLGGGGSDSSSTMPGFRSLSSFLLHSL